MNSGLLVLLVSLAVFAAGFLAVRGTTAVYGAYQRRFTDQARDRLEGSFVFVDPKYIFIVSSVVAFVLPLAWWWLTGAVLVPVVICLAGLFGPKVGFAVIERRRRLRLVLQLPDVLLMLASSLRAGTSLQIAMDLAVRETPAPLSQELGVVVREQRLGMALEDALESMGQRLKLEEIDLVVAAMTIARDIGGNLAETLDRLASMLRAKAVMEGKIRALTSQGKLQGLIVGLLPIFLMFVLANMQHDAMAPLFNTWIGYATLGVIGVLELVGFLIIRKIVNIDV